MHIKNLADHPEYIETIGTWHWEEWGHADPQGSLESWIDGIASRTNRLSIPATLIAIENSLLLGSICLVENDMDIRADLTPWVAGLLVAPEHRNHGVGSELMKQAMSFAADAGIETLYLYTSTAESLYLKLGWSLIDSAFYEGEDVSIMSARVV